MRSKERNRQRRPADNLARYFTKQLLVFVGLAFLIVVVDFFLYAIIAYRESDANFNNGTPIVTTRAVDSALTQNGDGSYTFAESGMEALTQQQAWALLMDASGTVTWSQDLPEGIPLSYTANDIAMAAHYANIADYPAFFWDRDDGLLVIGFPQGEFWHESLSFPVSTVRNLPLYVLLIFAVDLGILFAIYAVSRRRTQAAVGPIANALDALSEGKAATLDLKGDLREVGERINETSGIIEQKDTARANWIRGVSHDIRTPLSMILGYADGIAESTDAPSDVRAQAAVIRTQGLKIKDLVTDLNTASQLDYDARPLHRERVHLARVLRNVAASHANNGLDDTHPVELTVTESAAEAVILGDERLLTRAVENVLANARLHNSEGCTVSLLLTTETAADVAHIRISDDGAGITPVDRAALEARLARARTALSAAGSYGEEHGLGLVLVDRIVRAHQGTLALSSTPGGGFTVEMTLPLT